MAAEQEADPGTQNDRPEEAAQASDIISILKDKRNFQHMPEDMLEKLIQVMEVVHFPHGSIIMEQGKNVPYTFLILKGQLAIFVDGKYLLSLRRTGDVIGEMSFVNAGPCTASVKSESECDLVQISKSTLTEIGDSNFYIWLCRVLSDKLKRTSDMLSKE